MFDHSDNLASLNDNLSLKDKLVSIHSVLKKKYSFIARVAVTIYDSETRVLKTFLHSSGDDNPIKQYQALLDDSQSLLAIVKNRQPRVVNQLTEFDHCKKEHTDKIRQQGYAASYTLPMFHNNDFFGFLFFNSYESNVFSEQALNEIDVFAHLISATITNELALVKVMSAAIKTTNRMVHLRDPETGAHLERMSRYSRLIAGVLAEKYDLDDDYIEHVFMFAPLHDIGKIAIPDNILLKPGALTSDEREIMQTHPAKGREMIDDIVENFGLSHVSSINILRNIAISHHEAVNGSGYPEGKKSNEIPLEARIVAVSDVFDALTSERSYKKAWSNDKAIEMLNSIAGEKLDKDCVDALVNNCAAIEEIQARFKERTY